MPNIRFIDEHRVAVQAGRGAVEVTRSADSPSMSLRSVGRGLAVLHGWDVPTDPLRARLAADSTSGRETVVDLLYGDSEGGQRVVSRMSMSSAPGGDPAAAEHSEHRALAAARHWQLDRPSLAESGVRSLSQVPETLP